ncbi:hypothetical protein HBB16_17390 [Pseudonocardia sp. MCCB 268]|nr:hypothetical protein [Pseudonocardia cytotoxica]
MRHLLQLRCCRCAQEARSATCRTGEAHGRQRPGANLRELRLRDRPHRPALTSPTSPHRPEGSTMTSLDTPPQHRASGETGRVRQPQRPSWAASRPAAARTSSPRPT